MAGAVFQHDENDPQVPPTGEQLAQQIFVLVLAGVFAVIVLMVVMGRWWAA